MVLNTNVPGLRQVLAFGLDTDTRATLSGITTSKLMIPLIQVCHIKSYGLFTILQENQLM